MVDSEIIKTAQGFYVLANDTHISKWCIESGRLDHDQNALPRILPHINEGDCVIDIGAFIGDHTIAYANKVGISGKIIAFEPFPKSFECLELNMAGRENVKCHNKALGDWGGFKKSFVEDKNTGASFLSDGEETNIFPLDYLADYRPNFIKIDAEGMEVSILKGAENAIKRTYPKMMIEVNQGALQRNGESIESLFALLDEYGYRYENIYPDQQMSGPQFDILCIKK
jgi:FkbM family methyltransferase